MRRPIQDRANPAVPAASAPRYAELRSVSWFLARKAAEIPGRDLL